MQSVHIYKVRPLSCKFVTLYMHSHSLMPATAYKRQHMCKAMKIYDTMTGPSKSSSRHSVPNMS